MTVYRMSEIVFHYCIGDIPDLKNAMQELNKYSSYLTNYL